MPSSRDPRKVIEALLAKAADPNVTLEESVALTQKAQELREKYSIPKEKRDSPSYLHPHIQPMTREEFIHYFNQTPSGLHVTFFPTRSGKTFYFTWLSDIAQESPQANEEGWDLIDPNSKEYNE